MSTRSFNRTIKRMSRKYNSVFLSFLMCVSFSINISTFIENAINLYHKNFAIASSLKTFVFSIHFNVLQNIAAQYKCAIVFHRRSREHIHSSVDVFLVHNFIHVKFRNGLFHLITPNAKTPLCENCGQSFTRAYNLKYKHTKAACILNQNLQSDPPVAKFIDLVAPWRPAKNIFDKLAGLGVRFGKPRSELWRTYFVVFDCESFLHASNKSFGYDSVHLQHHKLSYISCATNLVEPHADSFQLFRATVDGDTTFVIDFIKQLMKYSIQARNRYHDDHAELFKQLNNRYDTASEDGMKKYVDAVRTELDEYYSKIVVYSYNGSSYDIPLLRNAGLFAALEHLNSPVNILKKTNSRYLTVSSRNIIFNDVMMISGIQTSYSNYLRRFYQSRNGAKMVYPYRLLTSYACFEQNLPKFDDFQDDALVGGNLLGRERDLFERLSVTCGSETAALEEMQLNSPPETAVQIYQQLVDEWSRCKFKTFGDLLIAYSRADTLPMLTIVIDLYALNRERDIDISSYCTLPSAISQSVAGLSTGDAEIYTFSGQFRQLLDENMVGGLSIVSFTRIAYRFH